MPKTIRDLLLIKAQLEIIMEKESVKNVGGSADFKTAEDYKSISRKIQSLDDEFSKTPPTDEEIDKIFASYPQISQSAIDTAKESNPGLDFGTLEAAPAAVLVPQDDELTRAIAESLQDTQPLDPDLQTALDISRLMHLTNDSQEYQTREAIELSEALEASLALNELASAAAASSAPKPSVNSDTDLDKAIANSLGTQTSRDDHDLRDALALSRAIEESRSGVSADDEYQMAIAASIVPQSKSKFYAEIRDSIELLRTLYLSGGGAAVNPNEDDITALKEQLNGRVTSLLQDNDQSDIAASLIADFFELPNF